MTGRSYRAYTSLANWESQTENSNITEPVENDVNPSTDLVSANAIMMAACYADGADTTAVTIDGWTTGDNNYIKIYTPVSSSEVGASQRHNGTWDDSKYRIESTSAPINIGAGRYRSCKRVDRRVTDLFVIRNRQWQFRYPLLSDGPGKS